MDECILEDGGMHYHATRVCLHLATHIATHVCLQLVMRMAARAAMWRYPYWNVYEQVAHELVTLEGNQDLTPSDRQSEHAH